MPFAYVKLNGLDRDRLLGVVEPVLRAHGLSGVEAIWRTDQRGRVLYLTVERPDSREPGAGVTLDVCSELSRDLSAALDVADVIDIPYRLEVGSPGLERKLYSLADYRRFGGKLARIKCSEPIAGQRTLRGALYGVNEPDGIQAGAEAQAQVVLDTDLGLLHIEFAKIESGQLELDLAAHGLGAVKPKPGHKHQPGQKRLPGQKRREAAQRTPAARSNAAKGKN